MTVASIILAAMTAFGTHSRNGCFVSWDDSTLTVSNRFFSRTYGADGDRLVTRSFTAGTTQLLELPVSAPKAGSLSAAARAARWSSVGEDGVEVTVKTGGRTRRLWLFASVPGVLLDDPSAVSLAGFKLPSSETGRFYSDFWQLSEQVANVVDRLRLKGRHLRVTEYRLNDMTDIRNELVERQEWLLRETLVRSAASLSVEDQLTGAGIAYLRFAPVGLSRPDPTTPDWLLAHRDEMGSDVRWVATVPTGYPVAELAYTGGEVGRLSALVAVQRALRPYRPGRDGVFLSNTWGDSNRDARINAKFMMDEVIAGGELGVDVIQIDDGWQTGKSSNSALIKSKSEGSWGDFRKNPKFWEPDPEKFPEGLRPLVEAARARGMGFGLWFGPDSSNDCALWNQDAETLLAFYRTLGIRYFKIDSLKMDRRVAYENELKLFDRALVESNGEMVFDLDVTGAVKRPGYLGVPDIGPVFVENRYWKTTSYWPHLTLRNVWSLAQVMDPVRLRMEILNPRHGLGTYPDTPLVPSKWRGDTLFAIVMCCSPLGWFEISELSKETVAEMKPLVARWKEERANLHGGLTLPVGEKPDGFAWTGFLTKGADGKSGYALLFRELNDSADFTLDCRKVLPDVSRAEVIGGRGTASLDQGRLTVTVPGRLDYVWARLR